MIKGLMDNINTEISLLSEISKYIQDTNNASAQERVMLEKSINSLVNSLRILNSSIPSVVKNITLATPLGERKASVERIEVTRGSKVLDIAIEKDAKEKFLQELRITEETLNKMRSREQVGLEKSEEEFKNPRIYIKLANKFCIGLSRRSVESGKFKDLKENLKKANMDILLESYVSVLFFTTVLSAFFGLAIASFFMFFNIELSSPFISIYSGGYLSRALWAVLIPIVVPILTFLALYFYPSTEQSSIAKHIEQELPFAVVHMSAISGSGVEPASIFRIVAFSPEYPYLRKEIRKILNQINIYGYDLVTALNNVSKNSPSVKLAELLSGLSTTINSGGNLADFFEKRAETLLIGYRLEREKFTKAAETFMDLYITVVIAAPMILLLIFVLLSISDFGTSLSPMYMTFIIITLIALVNIVFLAVLHIKQPRY